MKESFVDMLVELGLITKSQLEETINYQWEKGGKLEESLIRLGYFNEDSLCTLLSRKFGYHTLDLTNLKPDKETLSFIPYWLAKRFFLIPVQRTDTTLAVVMLNPLDREAMAELKKVVYHDIFPFVAKKSEIEKFILEHYPGEAMEDTRIISEMPPLLRKYTFDNFITGKCNDLAYSAALAVARGYSEDTNPLFIYSGVGLGKTHLLIAIWNYIVGHRQQRQIHFSSSDKFMNTLKETVEAHRINEFREEYSTIDVLLLDDIGLMAGDEVSQRHFFHIFNDLFQNSKQIVVTSDCQPKELSTLSSRIRSRFEGGLITRIDPPDLETRVAILKFKAKEVHIPDEFIYLIAEKVKDSVRELEGILKEIILFSKYKEKPPSKALIEEILIRRTIH